jgi:hypothetical protein
MAPQDHQWTSDESADVVHWLHICYRGCSTACESRSAWRALYTCHPHIVHTTHIVGDIGFDALLATTVTAREEGGEGQYCTE